MPSSNKERQARWRQRQREEKGKLEKELENAKAESRRIAREKTGEAERKLAEALRRQAEAEAAVEQLQETNRALRTQIRSLRAKAARNTGNDENHLDEDTWETLMSFDEKQLRQWVLAGRRFSQKEEDAPIETAIRWVTENRLR